MCADDVGHVYDSLRAKSYKFGISASCHQAIVLEGSYWKKRIEVVIKEYHKWRIYYKKRVSNLFPQDTYVFQRSSATPAAHSDLS